MRDAVYDLGRVEDVAARLTAALIAGKDITPRQAADVYFDIVDTLRAQRERGEKDERVRERQQQERTARHRQS